MAEAMRAASLEKDAPCHDIPSHGRGQKDLLSSLISRQSRGARDNLSVVLPALNHALSKLAGDPSDCAPHDAFGNHTKLHEIL